MRCDLTIGTAVVLAMTHPGFAGSVFHLLPSESRPYSGGEQLIVDVWVENQELVDIPIRAAQLDFQDTDPAIGLPSQFTFDFTSIPSGENAFDVLPDLPIPVAINTLDCLCPGYMLRLPGSGMMRLGQVSITLPVPPGVYILDVLNRDGPELSEGGALQLMAGPTWRAFDGDLVGGSLELTVVPEPATILVFLVALSQLLAPKPHAPGGLEGQARACTGKIPAPKHQFGDVFLSALRHSWPARLCT